MWSSHGQCLICLDIRQAIGWVQHLTLELGPIARFTRTIVVDIVRLFLLHLLDTRTDPDPSSFESQLYYAVTNPAADNKTYLSTMAALKTGGNTDLEAAKGFHYICADTALGRPEVTKVPNKETLVVHLGISRFKQCRSTQGHI